MRGILLQGFHKELFMCVCVFVCHILLMIFIRNLVSFTQDEGTARDLVSTRNYSTRTKVPNALQIRTI